MSLPVRLSTARAKRRPSPSDRASLHHVEDDLSELIVACPAQGVAEPELHVGSQGAVRFVEKLERAEGAFVMGGGLLERQPGAGSAPGQRAVADGPVDLAEAGRFGEVAGQLGPSLAVVAGAARLELETDTTVQAQAPAGRQLAIQRRAHQRVDERVAVRRGPAPAR